MGQVLFLEEIFLRLSLIRVLKVCLEHLLYVQRLAAGGFIFVFLIGEPHAALEFLLLDRLFRLQFLQTDVFVVLDFRQEIGRRLASRLVLFLQIMVQKGQTRFLHGFLVEIFQVFLGLFHKSVLVVFLREVVPLFQVVDLLDQGLVLLRHFLNRMLDVLLVLAAEAQQVLHVLGLGRVAQAHTFFRAFAFEVLDGLMRFLLIASFLFVFDFVVQF